MRIYEQLKAEFEAQAERFWTFVGENTTAHVLCYRSDNDRLAIANSGFTNMAYLHENWYSDAPERNCVAINFTTEKEFNIFRNTLQAHVINHKEQA